MADARKDSVGPHSDSSQMTLLDKVSDMVTVSDRAGRIFYANAATERITGYAPEIFTKRHPFESIHPDDLARCKEAISRLIETPDLVEEIEHRILHADGSWRWVEVRLESLFDDPAVRGLLATVRDVTRRKRSEEALQESEERFRMLVSASSDIVYRMSADWSEIHSLEGKSFLADTRDTSLTWFQEYIPEDDRPAVQAAIDEAIRSKTTFELEHRVIRADGMVGWTTSRAIPFLDERGEIVEWLGSASDITEHKRREERQIFLLKLNDALRPLSAPLAIQEAACHVLGEHLGANRVLYAEISEGTGAPALVRAADYTAGVPSRVGWHRLDDYGKFVTETWRAGQNLLWSSLDDLPDLPADERAAYEAVEIEAIVGVPLVKEGRFEAFIAVHQVVPRKWTAEEIALVEETVERTWAAAERAKAEAALSASEEKYRTLFDSLDEAVTTLEVIFDENDRVVDWRMLETNPATTKMTGWTSEIVGKLASEYIPGEIEPFWFDAVERVVKTGEPVHVEHPVAGLNDNWYEMYLTRIGGEDSRQIVVVYNNVTERKRREAALAFLAEITQDLAKLTSIDETMDALGQKIAAHFRLSFCLFVEVDEAAETAAVRRGWRRPDLPTPSGTYRISDFADPDFRRASRAGEPWMVADVFADPRTDGEKMKATFGVGSFMSVPLVRDGVWRFNIGAYDSEARDWRDDEIELLREITERIWARLERARAEETVQASEEQLSTLVEQSPLAIQIFAPDGTSLKSNRAWRAMWNLDVDNDPIGENIFEDERIMTTGLVPHLRRGARGMESVTDPILYDPASIGLEGESRWLRAFVYPVNNGNNGGEVLQVALMLQDATDSKLRAEERNRALVRDAAIRAERLERERISRELHDRVAHSMGVVHQSLELYKTLAKNNPKRAQERLELASRITRDVLNQTRNLAIELRRSVADEVENGLRPAVENMLRTLVPGDIDSRLRFAGDEPVVPSEASAQVYLVLREAVNNACRHSNCTDLEVRLDVDRDRGYIRGSVTDNGEGFDYDALIADGNNGIGLRAMRERAELLGGDMEVRSYPGEGTAITVDITLTGRSSDAFP